MLVFDQLSYFAVATLSDKRPRAITLANTISLQHNEYSHSSFSLSLIPHRDIRQLIKHADILRRAIISGLDHLHNPRRIRRTKLPYAISCAPLFVSSIRRKP